MTSIKIFRKGNIIAKVCASGHTGFAVKGEDIICSAVSSIIQTALLGCLKVVGIAVDYHIDEDLGELNFQIDENDLEKQHDANILLEAMLLGLYDLYENYSDYIVIEEKNIEAKSKNIINFVNKKNRR